jgi:hypothetical protein
MEVSTFSDIPYGRLMRNTEVVLLDIDPEHIHVFWHLKPDITACILRLHDLAWMDMSGANPHAAFDWRITVPSASAYLRIPGGGRSVRVELGLRLPYRRLDILARSEAVRLPVLRGAASDAPVLLEGALAPLFTFPAAAPAPSLSVAPSSWGLTVPDRHLCV